eukprot:5710092-Pyramimonas_sp.AAC.1
MLYESPRRATFASVAPIAAGCDEGRDCPVEGRWEWVDSAVLRVVGKGARVPDMYRPGQVAAAPAGTPQTFWPPPRASRVR